VKALGSSAKTFSRIFSVLASICLVAVLLLFAVQSIAYSKLHYKAEYRKLGVAAQIGITEEELMQITDNMVDYLKLKRDNLNMTATIGGQQQEVFTTLEKEHMHDVQVLFEKGLMLRNVLVVLAVLFAALVALIGRTKGLRILARSNCVTVIATIVLLSAAAALIATNFDRLFTQFHLVFFDNDKWILDPARHVLINMVPLQFFFDTAIYILVLTLIYWLILLAGSGAVLAMTGSHKKSKDAAA
jgi:integral membrane protein (TIGR01906 family)